AAAHRSGVGGERRRYGGGARGSGTAPRPSRIHRRARRTAAGAAAGGAAHDRQGADAPARRPGADGATNVRAGGANVRPRCRPAHRCARAHGRRRRRCGVTAGGGELVAQALAAASVRNVFTLVGGHTTPVVDACAQIGLGIVDVRHEEAAAHMAHAWARTTGEPGIALVTAGPGVTNTVTGVAHAWSGGAPLVVLAGRAPLAQADRGALHEMDQIALMRPITKWAATVFETERLPEYVARAVAEARSGRPA